jgi:hypothetical protein
MPYNSSFLNDLVLDEARDVAYLTDSAGPGGIIVYDHKQGLSRRYSGASTDNDPNYVVYINGIYYGGKIDTPADGIALSSDGEYIYYCAIQGDLLYRLPTSVLRDFSSSNSLIDQSVLILGKKQPSDGIVMWDDVLYFGSLPEATYYALDLTANKANDPSNAVAVWPDPVNMRWVSRDVSYILVVICTYSFLYAARFSIPRSVGPQYHLVYLECSRLVYFRPDGFFRSLRLQYESSQVYLWNVLLRLSN